MSELLAAGAPIQPTDPREVAEFYQPPAAMPIAAARKFTPRSCGWVIGIHGRVWVCR